MKVVFVHPHLGLGGAERQTVIALNAMAQIGHEPILLCFAAEGALLTDLNPAVKVVDLGLRGHRQTLMQTVRLKRALQEMQPDIIVAKLWSAILCTATAVRGTTLEARTCLYEDLDPTNHVDFVRFGRLKRGLISRAYRQHRGPIAANSASTALAMVRQYNLRREPIAIHPVPTPLATSLTARHPQQVRDFITVGSLIERKGLLQILRALELVDEEFTWTVMGDGPLRNQLAQHALFRSGRARLLSPDPDVYSYLGEADALLHYPLSEAFGVVVLEALVAGLPVLAADVSGPREISAMHSGVELVEPNCPVELAQHIGRWVRDGAVPKVDPIPMPDANLVASAWLDLAMAHADR